VAVVFIPSLLRSLTGGLAQVEVPAGSVRELVDALEARYPGMGERLCENDRLRSTFSVAVDGQVSSRRLNQKLEPGSEVHFLPVISGG
jgi:molybdopterin converting factor small subunit